MEKGVKFKLEEFRTEVVTKDDFEQMRYDFLMPSDLESCKGDMQR